MFDIVVGDAVIFRNKNGIDYVGRVLKVSYNHSVAYGNFIGVSAGWMNYNEDTLRSIDFKGLASFAVYSYQGEFEVVHKCKKSKAI